MNCNCSWRLRASPWLVVQAIRFVVTTESSSGDTMRDSLVGFLLVMATEEFYYGNEVLPWPDHSVDRPPVTVATDGTHCQRQRLPLE